MKEFGNKLRKKTQRVLQKVKGRQAEQQNLSIAPEQGESSVQPPPGLASSSQQATIPAGPSSPSSASPLTLDRFRSGLKEQNGSKDSLTADAQNREKSDTYAPRFMYQGTSKSNADSIEQTGIKRSYGGKEGGASKIMGDEEYKKNSQNVIHGTPSRRTALTYGGFHSQASAGGSAGEISVEDNTAYIGFEVEDTKSIIRDDDSDAGYKVVSQDIPPDKVVRVPNEIVEEAFDPTNPFAS